MTTKKQDQEKRLANALRNNLKKRRAQKRDAKASENEDQIPPADQRRFRDKPIKAPFQGLLDWIFVRAQIILASRALERDATLKELLL